MKREREGIEKGGRENEKLGIKKAMRRRMVRGVWRRGRRSSDEME